MDPPHRPIHPTSSGLTTTRPPNENTKTLAKICIPPPLLPTQLPMTTLEFQLFFMMYPRPQWISMASSRRGTSQGRPTTPTDSASDAVPATPHNYGGSLYKNLSNTGTRWWWRKNSSPATKLSTTFCNHPDHQTKPVLFLSLPTSFYTTDLRPSLRRHTKIIRIKTHG